MCCAGTAKDLSEDHKPENEIEKTRVEKAGGRITKDGRINGGYVPQLFLFCFFFFFDPTLIRVRSYPDK